MPVAVVTGANKGIGFGIVRALCKTYQGDVYLTARDEARGLAAVESLKNEGLNPKFHLLDLGNEATIVKLRDFMKENYGGIDVLVNNAGMAFKNAATEPFGEQATITLATNYWDNKRACEILFPILNAGARVVNMSSSAGFLGHIGARSGDKAKAEELKKTLSSDDLSVNELDGLMNNFVETANAGTHGDHGWPNSTYVVSKIGWSALSRIQQREMEKDSRKDIVINHVHPGYVNTDMTSHKGVLSIDRGSESGVFAAMLPPGTDVKGAYIWHDCQIVDWVNGPTPPMT
eukprot:TRINITY_DN11303_c0_g1_i3.p1 TRINITY_DN11303_c0_g1~~TRINITY_DN11303_c0_g1_i3.p1  ORF type:complete len:289 (+),score=68.66 TRINITY_DN11303_c0_g1_i3:69-935(+)